jgi:hypothetical protein
MCQWWCNWCPSRWAVCKPKAEGRTCRCVGPIIPHGPSGDGVRDVIAFLITTYSALRLVMAEAGQLFG